MSEIHEEPLFIAVDWGTSNLRAFLVAKTGQVLEQRESDQGMLMLNEDQFEPVLSGLLDHWLTFNLPVYMAGMVGSRGGWKEVPYQVCPVRLDDLSHYLYQLNTNFSCPVAIVPGLKGVGVSGHYDVMRGEETQLLGALDWLSDQGRGDENPMCCLPGTHCKWAQIISGEVKQFSTTFAGELFSRLNDESSLVKGLPQSTQLNKEAFTKGLVASQQAGGLLHHLFSARSQFVCGELKAEEVRDYLSGVVIGHDVNDILPSMVLPSSPVLIVGGASLGERYALALSFRSVHSEFLSASEASIRGLKRLVLNQQKSSISTEGIPL